MARFSSFVILGAMRTGSNFLEASLSELDGVTCYGEVFNPLFIGRENGTELFGVTLSQREADPLALLDLMRERTKGLPGFRFFQDHDPRILRAVLNDPDCGKIVLSRNPIDSFVSFKIALKTGEWLATGAGTPATAKVRFVPREFADFLEERDAFYATIRHALRTSGQTAFELGYEDLSDTDVLNGVAAWLGVAGRLDRPSTRLRRQNPPALADKVTNPQEVAEAVARMDLFALERPRTLEPPRNAAIHSYVAAARAPVMFLPIKAGPVAQVTTWLARLDSVEPRDLLRDMGFRTLRDWRTRHPGHRTFTVVRHPLERAHAAFVTHLLVPGPECYGKIRVLLRDYHGIAFPDAIDRAYSRETHRELFLKFLRFLKKNLSGLTSIRIDPAWAGQEAVLRGFAQRQVPDMVIREDRLAEGLAQLCAQVDRAAPELPPKQPSAAPVSLRAIYSPEIEAAAREVYAGDYAAFGFGDWSPNPDHSG